MGKLVPLRIMCFQKRTHILVVATVLRLTIFIFERLKNPETQVFPDEIVLRVWELGQVHIYLLLHIPEYFWFQTNLIVIVILIWVGDSEGCYLSLVRMVHRELKVQERVDVLGQARFLQRLVCEGGVLDLLGLFSSGTGIGIAHFQRVLMVLLENYLALQNWALFQ